MVYLNGKQPWGPRLFLLIIAAEKTLPMSFLSAKVTKYGQVGIRIPQQDRAKHCCNAIKKENRSQLLNWQTMPGLNSHFLSAFAATGPIERTTLPYTSFKTWAKPAYIAEAPQSIPS